MFVSIISSMFRYFTKIETYWHHILLKILDLICWNICIYVCTCKSWFKMLPTDCLKKTYLFHRRLYWTVVAASCLVYQSRDPSVIQYNNILAWCINPGTLQSYNMIIFFLGLPIQGPFNHTIYNIIARCINPGTLQSYNIIVFLLDLPFQGPFSHTIW